MATPLLEIDRLHVKYGNVEALHGISLSVNQDGHDLTLVHAERDAVKRLDVAVLDVEAIDLEQGGGHQTSSVPR